MKKFKYIFSVLALLVALVILAHTTGEQDVKVKPKTALITDIPDAQRVGPQRGAVGEEGLINDFRCVDINNKKLKFVWSNPELSDGIFEDFEAHESFRINSPGELGWSYRDMDNAYTYGLSMTVFPNSGAKMAYLIYDPTQTTPVGSNPNIMAFSGNKFLACFAADPAPNNDWIISPALDFKSDFQFSFRAKTFDGKYGLERVRIGYSTTGTMPSDFTMVSTQPYLGIAESWTLVSYSIPASAKYVAINCVSNDAFLLMIDDIYLGTNVVRPRSTLDKKIVGFNIYRDGVKINTDGITNLFFEDQVPEYRSYSYYVETLYSDLSTARSNEIIVEVPDIRNLPFVESFDSWSLDTHLWTKDPEEGSNWDIDYYEVGLVNPSAQYNMSRLTNYSQSLVSKELRTTDISNVWMRFDYKFVDYIYKTENTLEELSIEVSDNGGQSWQLVKNFNSVQGMTDWIRVKADISSLVSNELFQFRLRAHGVNAYNMMRWFVDNIKVWNPQWGTAELSVLHLGAPVSGAKVQLQTQEGDKFEFVSNGQGRVVLPNFEMGSYRLSILAPGYNTYATSWEMLPEQPNTLEVELTQPKIELSSSSVNATMLSQEKKTLPITISNTGNGAADFRFEIDYPKYTGAITNRFKQLNSFEASGDLQSSVVFDGEFYYAASYFIYATFYKYDKLGRYIEEFVMEDLYQPIYDMAFDGTYAYGSNGQNEIYQMDLRNKKIVRRFSILEKSDVRITHCTYDPSNGRLWVGDPNTLFSIDMNGVIKSTVRTLSTTEDPIVFGSAYDNLSPGGPYLWFASQVPATSGDNQIDCVTLRQWKISTASFTNVTHILTNVEGLRPGSITNRTFLTGIEASIDVVQGKLALVGVLQQSPSRIFSVELCEVNQWLKLSTTQGVLAPGETKEIELTMDALNATPGSTYSYSIIPKVNPIIAVPPITASMQVTGSSLTPRPVGLSLSVQGTAATRLSWSAPVGVSPTGYNIYRNDVLVNAMPIEGTEYIDENLLRGDYMYKVTALYGLTESRPTDPASIFIKIGAPCFPPISISAQVKLNKQVHLSWLSPDQTGTTPVVLRWDNGESKESLGLVEGGVLFAGSQWSYQEILPYRGMEITEVELYINDLLQDLKVLVYRDNEIVSQTSVNRSEIEYGAYNLVKLSTSVVIEPGYDYRVVARVVHQAGYRPIGMDNGPTKIGKGDIISSDGKIWNSLYRISNLEGNINIACKLEPSVRSKGYKQPVLLSTDLSTPVTQGVFYRKPIAGKSRQPIAKSKLALSSDLTLLGYKIYRDGVFIDQVSATSYIDTQMEAGKHRYQIASVYNVGQSLLSPSVEVEIVRIPGYYAPAGLKGEVILNKTVALSWLYPTADVSGLRNPAKCVSQNEVDLYQDVVSAKSTTSNEVLSLKPEFYFNFNVVDAAESGVAADSNYIYTCLRQQNGRINKYTKEGVFVETFSIPGVPSLIDITYDGTYFYGGMGGSSNIIYQMDFSARKLVSSFTVSEIVRHITFVPELDNGRGGFEVGDWMSSIYITLNGAKLGDGPLYKAAFGTAYHKGKLYAFEQAGANKTIVAIFDLETRERLGEIDLTQYGADFTLPANASAGGAAIVTTPLGGIFLTLCVQQSPVNRIFLFELDPPTGVVGYNVYCNDQQVNQELVTTRRFNHEPSEAGVYQYSVETVYMDQRVSAKSQPVDMVIEAVVGTCTQPTDLRAINNSYGYNIEISWVDPYAHTASHWEDAETLSAFAPVASSIWSSHQAIASPSSLWPGYTMPRQDKIEGWFVLKPTEVTPLMPIVPLNGSQMFCSMPAKNGATSNWLISPELSFSSSFVFEFHVRNGSDQIGRAQYRVMYSTGSKNLADFLPLDGVSYPLEQWVQQSIQFGPEVKYVALQHIGGGPLLVDMLSVDRPRVQNRIFGYDLFRNGKQLNTTPIKGCSYIDYSLLPGDYAYQVRAIYTSSCQTELTPSYQYSLDYNRSCEAPERFTAVKTTEAVELKWAAPPIGQPRFIGWHSGVNSEAIGVPGGGYFYAAVKFMPQELLAYYGGLLLSQVEIYLQSAPDVLFLIIYQDGKPVYQQEYTQFEYEKFSTLYLDQPISIDPSKELMVALYMEHAATSIPMGVDKGPGMIGKGDLFSSDGVNFRSLRDVADYDANWNISVGLSPYAQNSSKSQPFSYPQTRSASVQIQQDNDSYIPVSLEARKSKFAQLSQNNTFRGYNVYRNQTKLNGQPLFDLEYIDSSELEFGANTYRVSAIYSQCGEALSDPQMVVYLPNGVSDEAIEQIEIEPTRVRTTFNILHAPQGALVELYQSDGRKVMDAAGPTIDMSHCQPGSYMVRITHNGQPISAKRLIKIP